MRGNGMAIGMGPCAHDPLLPVFVYVTASNREINQNVQGILRVENGNITGYNFPNSMSMAGFTPNK